MEKIPLKRRKAFTWMLRGVMFLIILSLTVSCFSFMPGFSNPQRNLIAIAAFTIMTAVFPLIFIRARYMALNIALVYRTAYQKFFSHTFLKGSRTKAGKRNFMTNVKELFEMPFLQSKSDLPALQLEILHEILTSNNIPINEKWIKTMLKYIYNEEKLSPFNSENARTILAIVGIIISCIFVEKELGVTNILLSFILTIWLANCARQQLDQKKEFTSKREMLQQKTRLLNNYKIKYL